MDSQKNVQVWIMAFVALFIVIGAGLYTSKSRSFQSKKVETIMNPVLTEQDTPIVNQEENSITEPINLTSSLQDQENIRKLQENCKEWGDTILDNGYYGMSPVLNTHYKNNLRKCFVEISFMTGSEIADEIYDPTNQKQILSSEVFLDSSGKEFSSFYKDISDGLTYITEDQFFVRKNYYMYN